MTCWKCGAQAVDNTCTMCGCLQDTRLPAVTPNGKSLRYIYDKLGPAATLTNPTNFIRSLSDIFPDDEELKEQMTQVLQTNVGSRLYIMLSENKEIDEGARRELLHVVRNKCSLSDAEILPLLDLLLEMVGCGVAINCSMSSDRNKALTNMESAKKSATVMELTSKKQIAPAITKKENTAKKSNWVYLLVGLLFACGGSIAIIDYFFGLGFDVPYTFGISLLLFATYCVWLRKKRIVGSVCYLLSSISLGVHGVVVFIENIRYMQTFPDYSYSFLELHMEIHLISLILLAVALFISKYSNSRFCFCFSVVFVLFYIAIYWLLYTSERFDYLTSKGDFLTILLDAGTPFIFLVLCLLEGGHILLARSPKKVSSTSQSTLHSLQELYKAGVITREEYQTKRMEVLDRFENSAQ